LDVHEKKALLKSLNLFGIDAWNDIDLYSDEVLSDMDVQNALLENLYMLLNDDINIIELSDKILSNDVLQMNEALVNLLLDAVFDDEETQFHFIWELLPELIKKTNMEHMAHLLKNYLLGYLKESNEAFDFYYRILPDLKILQNDGEITQAVISNEESFKESFRYDVYPKEMVEAIKEIPAVLLCEPFVNELLFELNESDHPEPVIEAIYETPTLRTCPKIWTAVLEFLSENPLFDWLKDYFKLDISLHADSDESFSVDKYQTKIISLIDTKGWDLVKIALLQELMTLDWGFQNDWIDFTEIHDARRNFFKIFRMDEYAGYEGDIKDVLMNTTYHDDFDRLCSDLSDKISQSIENYIQNNNSTRGLDINAFRSSSASKLIPLILQARMREIEEIELPVKESCVDLRELWSTSYGYEVLSAMKVWKFCSKRTLSTILERFKELELNLPIVEGYGFQKQADNDDTRIFNKRIDSIANYRALVEGVYQLGETKHPETLDLIVPLIHSPSELRFEWKQDIDYYGWTRNEKPVPLLEIVDAMGCIDDERVLPRLRGLLGTHWNFDRSNYSRSTLYATLLKALERHHDRTILPSLLNLLKLIPHFVEEDSAPPKHASHSLDDLLESVVNILESYSDETIPSLLLQIYDKLIMLRYSDWEHSNAYRARIAIINGLKAILPSSSFVELLIDRLLLDGKYMNFDIARLLESSGELVIEPLIELISIGTNEQADASMQVLGPIGLIGIEAALKARQESESETALTRLNKFLKGYDVIRQLCKQDISIIDLSDTELDFCDLSPLKSCRTLREIILKNNRLSQIDLSSLSDCDSLETIDLSRNRLRTLDLNPISNCTNLKRLLLNRAGPNMLSDLDLTPLSKCSLLEELDISGQFHSMTEINLKPLSGSCNLKILSLGSNFVGNIDLNPLKDCGSLEHLNLGDMNLDRIDLLPLQRCTELQVILLRKNNIREIDLTPLMNCPRLHTFNLSANQHTFLDLQPLSEKKNIFQN